MRRISCFSFALMAAGLAFGQANVPPCNGSTTNCTDYFGFSNYANSPLPAGTITGFTVVTGGTGYTGPAVLIADPTGTGAIATATVDPNGVITGLTVTAGGTGYISPVVTITDLTGTGAMATATIGPPFTGGMRKFVDTMANLSIAVPDTASFPGSDYYVIGLQEYKQSMHADLPATKLRGYVQLNGGSPTPSYLGPVIVAQRNRPVRVLFKNMLPTGSAGNLFIPVDPTYMGAGNGPNGLPYSQNRATLHLHGGNTPWISDGTPHQWTVPPGESTTHPRGVSTAFVPDMWFDATGALITACAGQPTCTDTSATTDPGAGAMTFYWTNQQGGRLMFYHDHAYGITRLNVYAGEAAGYLLYDPTQEAALANATAPGTITDLGHLIPLVIQDKTFVPSAAQLAAEDPTWTAGNFGTLPGLAGAPSTANLGDLWFPHVYNPNQNPSDPDGVNAFGRWDYGPWFFPPQNTLTAANPPTALTLPCTSAAFPGAPPTPLDCPIIPNPSGTPEGFMDTPLVNGTAYPILHVAPAAYRFPILSAGNDRSLNLQLYVADASGTEVTMLPAVPPAPPATPLPLCALPTQITQPALGIGLATATLDAIGNPLNGTGLPANCWPTSWPTDGRDGGVPDPRTAGPPIIQIGTEGGLLPAPVVIPSTPTDFEYNRKSVTVLNVSVHGLWLGPAERADVIIDFSAYAGKTLILYNDAPAPAPAFDSRYDYYTGNPDQSSVGGAPSTQPGYGPNTRTIMQIKVDGSNPNIQTFSLAALKAAFTSTATTAGLFQQTQPPIIVPESTYNSAYLANFPNTYSSIQALNLTFTPITPLNLVQPGLGVVPCAATAPKVCATLEQKAIQELFTLDYGRMNATLGTEMPLTNFLTQTTIPLGYVDPPTEIIKDGETQLWKITHNGVDTHFMHFHLFNVQLINRMGWDGTVRPPDPNELGWKDTVRMNPLEDIVVAMQPYKPSLPWPLPNSIRPMDVTAPLTPMIPSQFTGVDPYNNAPAPVLANDLTNFGWEYVWHCHILGHEENDMMRPIVFLVPPPAPTNLIAAPNADPTKVDLTWTDNSASETSFTVQRASDVAFTLNVNTFLPVPPIGQNTAFGGTITITDSSVQSGPSYYRVQAVDDSFKPALTQTWNATPALLSAWSNTATVATPQVTISAGLAFGSQLVKMTSAPLDVTLTNTGTVDLAIGSVTIAGANPGDFAISANTCGLTLLAPPASITICTISVTFTPTAVGVRQASLNISSSNPTPLTATLSGTGIAPLASVSAPALLFGNVAVGALSTPQVLTLNNTGTASLTISNIGITGGNAGDFAISATTCTSTLTAPPSTSCTISVTLKPSALGTRSSVLVISSSDPVQPTLNVSLTGAGSEAIAGVSPGSLAFPLQLVNTSSLAQSVTLSNTGNTPMTIKSISLTGTNPADFVLNFGCPIGGAGLAAGSNCAISLNFRPAAAGSRTASLTIISDAIVNPTLNVLVNGTGTAVNLSSSALTYGGQLVGTTSAIQSVTLSNVGTTTFSISGITLTGTNPADFTLATNCGTSVAANASCRVNVRFRPTATGVRLATLQINTSDPGMPSAKVGLTGTGTASAAILAPASLNFGTVTKGQNSTPQAVTLTNGGTGALIISGISIGGTNGNRFSRTYNCPIGGTGLAVGASCTINVTFSPNKAGAMSAILQVTDNAANSPQTVALSGTGQ